MLVSTVFANTDKIQLKVLFVGYSPEKEMPVFHGRVPSNFSPQRFKEEYKTRMPAFIDFLNEKFVEVKGVDARDYKENMSAGYDVTIFDQPIEPIKKGGRVKNEKGEVVAFKQDQYFSDDYDHATIFCSYAGGRMGPGNALKLDWCCLCLDADAFNMNRDHEIFNKPVKVKLTMEEKKTPDLIFKFCNGSDVPKTLPMWRVQKEGFKNEAGYRSGLVARGFCFKDSPDAEFISGGVSLKDIDAVALGRHGNFFLWGFSGSPDYMNDESRQVFVNTIVYMSKFKGQKPIVRKENQRELGRDYSIKSAKFNLSRESYEAGAAETKKFNEEFEKKKAEIKIKKEKGEKLSQQEQMYLSMGGMQERSWEEHIQLFMGKYYKTWGNDYKGFLKWFDDNREYLYPSNNLTKPNYLLDEDLKSLNVSNRDLKLFEKCIPMLKDTDQKEKALSILYRYTKEKFLTEKEWKKWYKENKKKLFFTEAGGFKWIVNTL
jgi:hypothetical protein